METNIERDKRGRFAAGNGGGPGRPKREREVEYYRVMEMSVTLADWRAIVTKAVEQAKRGDAVARKWIADYLIGTPPQRHELTGADGDPLKVNVNVINVREFISPDQDTTESD